VAATRTSAPTSHPSAMRTPKGARAIRPPAGGRSANQKMIRCSSVARRSSDPDAMFRDNDEALRPGTQYAGGPPWGRASSCSGALRGPVRDGALSLDADAGDGPADDQLLDLLGALEDVHDLRVAVPALHRVLPGVAVAAQDL